MGEGVIANDMSRLRYRARNIGKQLHVAADHEERRPHTMLRQHIEQLQRVRIVRPVIVGQGDLLAPSPEPRDRASIPLPSRRHGLIPRCRSRRGGR